MPLYLGQFAVMEYLWETLEKAAEGTTILYTPLDIEMLWKMGFVDTQKYSVESWKLAFEPYRQQDNTFLLDKDAFFSLDKYRYKGEIHIPFDAMKINEGFYTDEGLQELIDASIVPSCSLDSKELTTFFDKLKTTFRSPDGLIKIGTDAKLEIKKLIEKNPSPLRNLEILFDQMLVEGVDKQMEKDFEGAETEMATARAAIEASTFTTTPTSKAEASSKGLKGIAKAKEKVHVETEGGVALKKIRRSRKGMRG